MKKNILFLMVAVLFFMTACDYNDINFEGLDEKAVPTDVKSLSYTLLDADYTTIANNSANKTLAEANDVSAELSSLKSTLRFSDALPASKFVPAFLTDKWFTADDGSSIKVTYNKTDVLPEYLSDLSAAATYTVTSLDYASVWGTVSANYFTPAKPLSGAASRLLNAAYPEAESGDVKIISYNYSSTEPGGDVPLETSIDESFDGVTVDSKVSLSGWSNIAEKGSVYWQGNSYDGNFYTQMSAYGASSEVVSWLISPTISLADAEDPMFAFEIKIGYYNADCLQVLISDDYNGLDPTIANWIDVTSQFTFYNVGAAYGPMYISGLYDMSGFKSKPITIAFKYTGDGANLQTTTYQIDNVQVGGAVDVISTEVFSEPFTDLSAWGNILVQGTKTWLSKSYSGNYYTQYSAYGTTEEQEGWLVSPAVAVPATGVAELLFDITVANYNATCLSVMVSTDYSGDVTTATWDDLSTHFGLPVLPTSGYGTMASAGAAPLNKYAGQTIYVAFKYVGNGAESRTTTYQVDNVQVVTLSRDVPAGAMALKSASSTVNDLLAIYTFNGTTWIPYSNASILNPSDYSAMGISYFSSSVAPDNYMPSYLTLQYPYAEEGKEVAVVYFYGNATTLAADEYAYVAGVWVKNNAVEIVTDQFVRANGKWIWDPSVVINLVPVRNDPFVMSYYQAATDWVWTNVDQAQLGITTKGLGYVTSYGTNEYYTGCSAYQNTVDMRPTAARNQYAAGYTGLSDDEVTALMKERLAAVMKEVLSVMNSDAKTIDGVDVTYTVNLGFYVGTNISKCTHSLVYKVVGPGEFEYVSGPTEIK